MSIKSSLKKTLLIITVSGLTLFIGFIFNFIFFKSGINSGLEPLSAKVTALYEQEQVGIDFPVRIKIPKINVNTAIEYVGVTETGALGVTKGPVNVAWYKDGVRPGDIGSAVIDGHSGWKNGIPAVFDNLYKLKKGDKIYIEDKKGTVITFIVNRIKKFDPNADASELFSSNDGLAHLNLITCAGTWNTVTKTHSERLVVFTDKE